jgi:hypothetical protein
VRQSNVAISVAHAMYDFHARHGQNHSAVIGGTMLSYCSGPCG